MHNSDGNIVKQHGINRIEVIKVAVQPHGKFVNAESFAAFAISSYNFHFQML